MIESALAAALTCFTGADEVPLDEECNLFTLSRFLCPVTASPPFFLAVLVFLVFDSSVNHCFDVWFIPVGLFRYGIA
jgi:hypothetical protein